MTDTPDRNDVSRRSVLRNGAFASGAVLLGGTTLVGPAAAIDDSFGFVPDEVNVSTTDTVTLVKRMGKERVKCAFRGSSYEIDTEVFEVDDYVETGNSNGNIYLATHKFEEGDTVDLIDENFNCQTSDPPGLKEVDLGTVDF